MKFNRLAPVACFVAAALFALSAIAQVAAPAVPDTTVSAGGLFGAVRPFLLDLAGVIVAGILGWLSMQLNKWFGINVEKSHRDALHSAIMTGVAGALNYAGERAADLKVDVRNKIIKDGIDYALKSVPDAVKALQPSHAALVEIASSKLGILVEAPASVPVGKAPGTGV